MIHADCTEIFELYAIRYAYREGMRATSFLGGDPHDGPMPMDYFIWLARSPKKCIVIDTGFTAEEASRRKRTFLKCPLEILKNHIVKPELITDVILTHLHYDHAGNCCGFPNATFHLQEAEMRFATGKFMGFPFLSHSFNSDDICDLVRLNFAERVRFYEGDETLAEGINLHKTGGHSAGLQFVSVNTKRGLVILASDTSHFYENFKSRRPFKTAFHVGEMLGGFDNLLSIAPTQEHIIPGHDPLVKELYPELVGSDGLIFKLHENPKDNRPQFLGKGIRSSNTLFKEMKNDNKKN